MECENNGWDFEILLSVIRSPQLITPSSYGQLISVSWFLFTIPDVSVHFCTLYMSSIRVVFTSSLTSTPHLFGIESSVVVTGKATLVDLTAKLGSLLALLRLDSLGVQHVLLKMLLQMLLMLLDDHTLVVKMVGVILDETTAIDSSASIHRRNRSWNRWKHHLNLPL